MRLRGVVLILILSTSFSCKKDETPAGILTEQQMVGWMLDMYLAESRVQALPYMRDSSIALLRPYQDSILRRHGVTDSTIRKSYQYYYSNPGKMEHIYDILIDSLSLREQRLLPGPANKLSGAEQRQ